MNKCSNVQVTKPSKHISATTSPILSKKVKGDREEVSTETTVSVSVRSSSSVVSTESNVSLPDIRLKIKSEDGEKRRNNNTNETLEVRKPSKTTKKFWVVVVNWTR